MKKNLPIIEQIRKICHDCKLRPNKYRQSENLERGRGETLISLYWDAYYFDNLQSSPKMQHLTDSLLTHFPTLKKEDIGISDGHYFFFIKA